MANVAKRLPTNVLGNFFVDSTCINCDTCRQLAPTTFLEKEEYSSVYHQPETGREERESYQALLACPVGSIGVIEKNTKVLSLARQTFPLHLEGGVYYNGFNSEKSFGANSYFVQHPDGNWLIDSPRYMKDLVEAFERMGSLRYVFLSHEDDVADAGRYAQRFKATRLIHDADAEAMPDAEWIIASTEPVQAAPEFLLIPVPGHTAGSMALLYQDRYLFTGDHLWWDRETQHLQVPSVLVQDHQALRVSTRRLLDYPFEWILPGHGDRIHLPRTKLKEEIRGLLTRRGDVCDRNP